MVGIDHATIVAVYEDEEQANAAVQALVDAGFSMEQVGYAAKRGGTGGGGLLSADDTKAAEGTVIGAVGGAGAGALAGAALAGLIPGIGPVVTAGALATIIATAGYGAVTTGLVGALVGLGISDEEARYFEDQFRAGHPLVMVRTEDRQDEARAILSEYGGRFRPAPTAADTPQLSEDADDRT